jgi:AraC family transcriptional regulator, carnitine catabolism transcriptional activator
MAISSDFRLPRDVGFLLIPGFSMLAFSSAMEPLRLANLLLGQRFYRWRIYTRDGQPARASCGMKVPADGKPDHADAPPCLLVIAGFDPWPQEDRRLKSWLRSLDRHGAVLGAVDTGSFLLASAGLLGNTPVSLHWESAAAFSELFPDTPLSQELFEVSARRLLCAGGAAVLDMMLHVLERTHGATLCAAIAERLIYSRCRPAAREQRPALNERLDLEDADVLNAVATMERSVEGPINIGELCAEISVSQRTLERKFRRAFGRTPKQVYLNLRLDHARGLLRHSNLTVREVAVACGFSSVSYFCRAYKDRFSLRPGKDRQLDYNLVKIDAALSLPI